MGFFKFKRRQKPAVVETIKQDESVPQKEEKKKVDSRASSSDSTIDAIWQTKPDIALKAAVNSIIGKCYLFQTYMEDYNSNKSKDMAATMRTVDSINKEKDNLLRDTFATYYLERTKNPDLQKFNKWLRNSNGTFVGCDEMLDKCIEICEKELLKSNSN